MRRVIFPLLLLLLPILSGCPVGPDFVRPQRPAVSRYTPGPEPAATIAAEGQVQQFHPGAAVPQAWWQLFSSARLNAVVNEALVQNPGLDAAQARLRQSQEDLRAGYGVFFPQIDGSFDASRQKFSPARFGTGASGSIFNLFTLSAAASYALDVFGGNRRAVEALAAQEEQQRALLQGTYLTLTGNVVNTMVALAGYREEIRVTEQLIAMQREQVAITRAQVEAGITPYVNLLSLESQLASVEGTLPPLRQRRDQAEHLLATLAGKAPAQWIAPELELSDLALPRDLPVSLPSELVRGRPDILAAEAQLHSASAAVGVATAALFPSVTLNANFGQNSSSIGSMLEKSGQFWSVGADLAAPLFHGGTLWFRRKAAIEAYRESLADYRQTVLSAFAQVADTLRALEHDAEAVAAQGQALAAARDALRLITANYQAGSAGYLQVVVANYALHQAMIGYVDAKAKRYQDTVALFVALGGGWLTGPEETTSSSGS